MSFLVGCLLFVGFLPIAQAQEVFEDRTAKDAQEQYLKKVAEAEETYHSKLGELRQEYLTQLRRILELSRMNGKQETVVQIEAEIKRVQATSRSSGTAPVLKTKYGNLQIFPADNAWNQPIDKARVHLRSAQYLEAVGLEKGLHPDFGTVWKGAPSGIPFIVVDPDQPKTRVQFEYADESDPGPYPIPKNPPIEGGPQSKGDRHIIMLNVQEKKLYELFSAYPTATGWKAGSGAIFDLTTNKLRPRGWTSADAAGLAVFPGLVRYDEVVEQKEIRHALRFTVRRTQRAYILPATHFASRSTDPNLMPMGLRVRLKADYDISKFPAEARVILQALKTYGMILADNGSDFFISGAPNPRWNEAALRTIKKIKGKDLEVVETGELIKK